VTVEDTAGVPGLVDHLFRHSAGQMVSVLTRYLGAGCIDVAEEAVQDALLKALQTWPYRGIPHDPRAWLFTAARNRARDLLRRDSTFTANVLRAASQAGEALCEARPEGAAISTRVDLLAHVEDDELAMMLMCCHPELPAETRIVLTLKTVGGFSVREIAAGLLSEPAAVAQRIVRAKRTIVEKAIEFEIPRGDDLSARLSSVLDVLYLMFNEGYTAHEGENLVRSELCHESIRLARLLLVNARTSQPRVHALLALMLLQASRLVARTAPGNDMVLLPDQDRSSWDATMLAQGMRHLQRSASGNRVTRFHIEAAIAAAHAVAAHDSATDWPYILRLYDDLSALTDSPVIRLNRAVAVARVHGPRAGLEVLESIRAHPALRRYYLLPATLAGLSMEAGDTAEAARWYREALSLPCSEPERRFMRGRLSNCEAR
jgi:RNA polymerase sigma-70 factor (ECF subfamily)